MLVELAVGDAYGAGFEYATPEVVRGRNDLSTYVKHPRHGTRPGHYTDDTQMSIAVAEALVSGEPWTRELLAGKFVEAFQRDPREGYAARFHEFLLSVTDGQEFLQRIRPDSDKSGAAMRAAPIGVLPELPRVIEMTTLQARLTHDTPGGIAAAVAAALMSHYCLYRLGPKVELGHFLEGHVPGEWSVPWQGKVGSKGWMSVRAAVTLVSRAGSMSDLLRDCIDLGGDVDTVASIALAAGACSAEIEQDLPAHLVLQLENGLYGRDYLQVLDERLMSLAGPIRA